VKLNEYQKKAREYALSSIKDNLDYALLGLCEEVGEVSGLIKRIHRGDATLTDQKEKLKSEIGDVLWYLSQTCSVLGFELSDVAAANLLKLNNRKVINKIKGVGSDR
jgi:NTP pyrophosphatase (non-canonical NTP hydrolase)